MGIGALLQSFHAAGVLPSREILRRYTLEEREGFAFETGTLVQYLDEEVDAVRQAEEQAALRAMPPGYSIEQLNGINVGCGVRPIHAALCQVDAHRGEFAVEGAIHEAHTHLLSFASDLPFRAGALDFILGLHLLEHEDDPVSVVRHWLNILKPGGGIGLILPDYRYTWDAREDDNEWAHRWSPTPAVAREMHETYWAGECALEHLQTYVFKLSFDVVLRKPGEFHPFCCGDVAAKPTGRELAQASGGRLYPPPRPERIQTR